MRSLQGKILFVYFALAALAIGLSLLALLEINLIASKVHAGSKVADFFDATLEVRRFEKNLFLYGQSEDLRENARYTEHALDLIQRNADSFATLIGVSATQTLAEDLRRYKQLMIEQAGRPHDEVLATEVRALGKRIVTAGESLATQEHQNLRAALDAHQRNLLLSMAIVAGLLMLAGFMLARWITRPLKIMESRMEAVAQGQLTRMELDFRERELASLTQAFNHVLDELERRQHTLVRSEKLASLGTLLSGVAHEINNPLSNISASAQILNEAPDTAPDFRQQLLVDIDQESQRAAQIVRSLLDYARDRDFLRTPVNLVELVAETLRFLKTLKSPGVEIKINIPADLVIAADRPRLQQALINLIKNALEAIGSHGELTIAGSRNIADHGNTLPNSAGICRPGTSVVDLTITDTGPGIPPEVLPRIFDPFFTTKPVGHGNGLGLFIVHEIIDEHGGCIGVDCPPHGGTHFYIRLPIGETPGVKTSESS